MVTQSSSLLEDELSRDGMIWPVDFFCIILMDKFLTHQSPQSTTTAHFSMFLFVIVSCDFTVTRKSDHLFTAKNIKTASEILKTQLFFDLKFKSLFYKNDRKQPDLWSFYISFFCRILRNGHIWSWILTSFSAPRQPKWSIYIKIQPKLRYFCQNIKAVWPPGSPQS